MKRRQIPRQATSAAKPTTVSRRTLWRWKRQSQARDRERIASGKLAAEDVLFLRPEKVKGASVVWYRGSLMDESPRPRQKPATRSKREKQKRPASKRGEAKLKTGLAPLKASNPRVLILGSFPSEESLRLQQYYANPKNQFWRLMEAVAGVPCNQPYKQRARAIAAQGIALWDVLHSCKRDGSLDKKIKKGSAVPNDIGKFLARLPSIEAIALNGGTAAKIFYRNFNAQHERALQVVTLPSSSSAHAMKLEKKARAWSVVMNSHGSKSLEQNREAIAEYNKRLKKYGVFAETVQSVQRQLDKQFASLRGARGAQRLRAAIRSRVKLRGRVKTTTKS